METETEVIAEEVMPDSIVKIVREARNIQRKIDRETEIVRMAIDSIKKAHAEFVAEQMSRMDDLKAEAKSFMLTKIDEGHGLKSWQTPYGKVSLRKDIIYDKDEMVLDEWARSHGYIKEKKLYVLAWSEIRNGAMPFPEAGIVYSAKGEIIDGLTSHEEQVVNFTFEKGSEK